MSCQEHFSRRHYEAQATGPVSFLNPTVRRKPLPSLSPTSSHKTGSQDTLHGVTDGEKVLSGKKDEEIAASDIHHKWTSRNNRKGLFKDWMN